ncbi:MAG: hypothetical protein NVSMB52_18130 [Chloroflexota bacterium]
MQFGHVGGILRSRVNPLVPVGTIVAGLAIVAAGYRSVGAGVMLGAVLAYINGLLLSRRVDVAANTGDIAGAMAVMQIGLVVTMTIIGLAIVATVHFSLTMAISAAAGFAITQMGILAAYYWSFSRNDSSVGTNA